MINRLNLFLDISVYLTGFDKAELQGTGMLETYFHFIEKLPGNNEADKANLDFFFEEVSSILDAKESGEERKMQLVSERLMPSSCYNGLAQSIINIWYTGYYNNTIISSQSYIQALMWKAAETHPPGAQQPGFGSWSLPPL